jgi:SAM-dependent methyltransferase
MYEYAMNKYGEALDEEFNTAIEVLNPYQNDIIVNIPGGGNPIHKYISDSLNVTILSFEPLRDHNQDENTFCDITAIPLEDNSVDKVLSLASFHHFQEERREVLMEFRRILKHNGTLVIGDVIQGSAQDSWLNVFVNKYNSNGHTGLFLDEKDIFGIEALGYNVKSSRHTYNWSFRNDEEAVDFVKNLFGLNLLPSDEFLLASMKQYLAYKDNKFEWQLLYFTCIKL